MIPLGSLPVSLVHFAWRNPGQQSRRNQKRRPWLHFPNFPPKDDGQRSHALRFRLRDCAHNFLNPTGTIQYTLRPQ